MSCQEAMQGDKRTAEKLCKPVKSHLGIGLTMQKRCSPDAQINPHCFETLNPGLKP